VISGKKYPFSVSEASGFCFLPVNGNGIFVFRNHLKDEKFPEIPFQVSGVREQMHSTQTGISAVFKSLR